MTRVLVTGATGFVGGHLCAALGSSSYLVRAALRESRAAPAGAAEVAVVGEINSATDWRAALADVDIVVHAAARAHRLNDTESEPYLEVNGRGTLRLAQAAARAGVRRLVYLSTIKVNGEGGADRPYTASDPPQPRDAYGQSKWLGEQHLQQVVGAGAMQGVVVRAPLVYGPGVKGNFLRLLRWVQRDWPIPLGSVNNARSLVSVWNLCDFLRLVLEHPAASGRTWLVSDGEDLSTPELVRRMASAMGRSVRLWRVPPAALAAAAAVTGRGGELARLCGSLRVDSAVARGALGWSPPLSVTEGIARTVAWFSASEPARAR
jgi:nucleoside-diphosphate-sugar epimerase